jgi:hypothetical protein
MKKLIPFVLYSTAAALCLGAVSAFAGYVTPRVPPGGNNVAARLSADQPFTPKNLPTVRTVTTVHDNGPGSLRQAIASSSPGDVIRFALRLPATIVLSSTLVIDQDLTVLGPGPDKLTVMRSHAANTPSFRVFDVEAGVVAIAGITIRNGIAFDASSFVDNIGGGIYNRGTLTVSNCVITGNSAPSSSAGGTNSLGFGGGIFSDRDSQLAIVNSTISGNQASAAGGGICTFDTASFMAEGCTISGNFAGLQGGGLNFQGDIGTMQNCTISDNATSDADPDAGGGSGILNVAILNQAPPMLTVTACTVARNTGTTNGAFTVAAYEQLLGITNRLLSTLVADNDGPNFFFYGNITIQSLGHNLDSDGTSGLANGVNGDLVGTVASPIDAKLGPLQNNGGPTLTMALLPGSPALGTAACSDADGAPLTVDQRGLPRPQVTGCDIGAFENQAPTLICPAAQTLEGCGPHNGPLASLAATVADPDGDALTVVWSVNGISRQTNHVAATHPPQSKVVTFIASFSQGTNIVTVWVSDGKAVPVACSTGVIVRDKTPPRILSIKAVPDVLWPANGKLMPVRLIVQAVDHCGPVTSRISSVRSNEPPDASQPDWVITGDLTLLLRAERSPHGNGRVYTITVQCSDAFGNTSTGTVLVTVPRDGGGWPGF